MIFWTRGWRTNVLLVEGAEGDLLDRRQDLDGMDDAGLGRLGQVDLGDVRGDDDLGIEARPGQEHLHLFAGCVLGLVHDDEGAVSVRPRI